MRFRQLRTGGGLDFLIGQARQRDANAFFFAEAYAYPFAGSGDQVTSMQQLIDVGFDAVYHDPAYDLLKGIYQGNASQDDYYHEMAFPPIARTHVVEYLENHDERRLPPRSPSMKDLTIPASALRKQVII